MSDPNPTPNPDPGTAFHVPYGAPIRASISLGHMSLYRACSMARLWIELPSPWSDCLGCTQNGGLYRILLTGESALPQWHFGSR